MDTLLKEPKEKVDGLLKEPKEEVDALLKEPRAASRLEPEKSKVARGEER